MPREVSWQRVVWFAVLMTAVVLVGVFVDEGAEVIMGILAAVGAAGPGITREMDL